MKRKARKDIEDIFEDTYYKDIHKEPPKKRSKVQEDLPPKPKKVVNIDEFCNLLDSTYESIKLQSIDPVDCLVRTILSQNTRDVSTKKAYDALKKAFPTWEDVIKSPLDKIQEVLHSCYLYKRKSSTIVDALKKIKEDNKHGEISLDFMNDKSDAVIQEYLESFPGIGPKTASCVLLIGMKRPSFPVDTHIHRIIRRVGLAPETATPTKVQELLNEIVPKERIVGANFALLQLGKEKCKPKDPKCSECCLKSVCMRNI